MPTLRRLLLILAAPALLLSVASAFEIIAHRGASKDAPENTLAAAKLAYEQGADYVECDIYLSSDGKLVVLHDATTQRTTGIVGEIEKMALPEIKKLSANYGNAQFAAEKIPTLEELLAVVPDGKKLIIEIKTSRPEAIPELKAALERSGTTPKKAEIFCFKFATLQACEKLIPEFQTHWLNSYSVDKETGKPKVTLDELIEKAKAEKFEGLSLSEKWPIDAAFAKKVHDAGLRLFVWTVNDPAMATKLHGAGVTLICTDRPAFIRQALTK